MVNQLLKNKINTYASGIYFKKYQKLTKLFLIVFYGQGNGKILHYVWVAVF